MLPQVQPFEADGRPGEPGAKKLMSFACATLKVVLCCFLILEKKRLNGIEPKWLQTLAKNSCLWSLRPCIVKFDEGKADNSVGETTISARCVDCGVISSQYPGLQKQMLAEKLKHGDGSRFLILMQKNWDNSTSHCNMSLTVTDHHWAWGLLGLQDQPLGGCKIYRI